MSWVDSYCFFPSDFLVIVPYSFCIFSTMLVLVIGVLITGQKFFSYPVVNSSTLNFSLLIIFLSWFCFYNFSWCVGAFFDRSILLTPFSFGVQIIVLLSVFLVLFGSKAYIKTQRLFQVEFCILVLFSVVGLLFLIVANDFLMLFLALELQSLCFYVLASFRSESEFSAEAGAKYFVLGAFSTALILFGFSFFYGVTCTYNFIDIQHWFLFLDKNVSVGISLSLACILSAFFFKVAAAPFHMWALDVYEGSPLSVTAFFALVPKIVILGLFGRLLFAVIGDGSSVYQPVIATFGFFSVFVGTFGALLQKKIKRLMAYSAVSHVGFILIGLSSATFDGFQSFFLYLVFYLFTSGLFFGLLLQTMKMKAGSFFNWSFLLEFKGLGKSNPVLALFLTLTFFSMAGIPPLAGFFGKFMVFLSAIRVEQYFVVLSSILLSVISSFYYIRLVKLIYFDKKHYSFVWVSVLGKESILFFVPLFYGTCLSMVFPVPFFVFSSIAGFCS